MSVLGFPQPLHLIFLKQGLALKLEFTISASNPGIYYCLCYSCRYWGLRMCATLPCLYKGIWDLDVDLPHTFLANVLPVSQCCCPTFTSCCGCHGLIWTVPQHLIHQRLDFLSVVFISWALTFSMDWSTDTVIARWVWRLCYSLDAVRRTALLTVCSEVCESRHSRCTCEQMCAECLCSQNLKDITWCHKHLQREQRDREYNFAKVKT